MMEATVELGEQNKKSVATNLRKTVALSHSNAMKRTIIHSLLFATLSKCYPVNGFISRSPLFMSNGDNQIIHADSVDEPKKTSSSISTSTSPLNPTMTSNSIEKRSTKDRRRIYREKGRPPAVKKIKPPLVDSTLLRFLSAQKDQLAEQKRKSNINNYMGDNDMSPVKDNSKTNQEAVRKSITEYSTNMNDTELIKSMTENLMMIESKSVVESTTTKFPTSSKVDYTTAASISWFTQYSAQNVAKKLIDVGASKDEAYEAGNAVQNYSLTKTTRQRVRKFLSERDSMLSSSATMTLSDKKLNGSNNKIRKISANELDFDASNYSYNIANVMEVLTNAGLTGKDIAAIFTHTPSVSMMQTKEGMNGTSQNADKSNYLEDSLDKAFHGVLCSTIKLRKYDARKVLRTCPGLLTKRGSTSSSEVISILTNLGISPTSLCRDKKALPVLLARSPASLFRLVAFFSSDAVRMPVNRIGQVLRRSECACLLDYVAPLTQKPNIDSALTVETFFNNGSNAMETEITRRYKSMFRTAKYLRRNVGIIDLGRSISAYPNILTLGVEDQIVPCIEFLNEEVELFEEEIPRVLEVYPQLLGADIAAMRKNLNYFRSLEVAEEDLGSIFRSFPALLVMEIDEMSKVVKFLKEVGVRNIGRFVTRLPAVLGYSVENDLLPKWKFLTQVRHYASFEISRFPGYFSYPLDRVIKCRYEYLQNVKQLPVKYFPIDEVLRYGDKDFAISVAKDFDETAFLEFAEESKKKKNKSRSRKRKKMKAGKEIR